MAPILELQSVTKSYFIRERELPILKDVSMTIQRGEFVGIMGPSGSGKSTLLHLMGALDHPTSGVINIEGRDIAHWGDAELARLRNKTIGFVFQNFFLLNYYTAMENVCLPLVYAGTDETHREKARQLLERVGLGRRTHHRPHEMSGGERQRVAIARALINQPAILYADEPTGNLDTKTGESIMEILRDIHEAGTTVILITHDPHVARRAERVIRIEDGMIV